MTFEEIVHFLKNDIWGLIILGGLGSILGSLLIYFGRKLYLWLAQHYKVFRTKYFFRQLMQNYSEGYTAGLAINSTYSQALLVGRYIINCIKHFSLLIILLTIGFGLLAFVPFYFYWIVVLVLGITIVFPIIKIKRNLKYFNQCYDQQFDEKLLKEKALEYLKEEVLVKKVAKDKNK